MDFTRLRTKCILDTIMCVSRSEIITFTSAQDNPLYIIATPKIRIPFFYFLAICKLFSRALYPALFLCFIALKMPKEMPCKCFFSNDVPRKVLWTFFSSTGVGVAGVSRTLFQCHWKAIFHCILNTFFNRQPAWLEASSWGN